MCTLSENNKYRNKTGRYNVREQKTNMSTQKVSTSEKNSIKMNSKVIKVKTQEFLSSRRKLQPLNDIVNEFEVNEIEFYLHQNIIDFSTGFNCH